MEVIDPKIIDALKSAHGAVWVLSDEHLGVQIVVRKPARHAYKRFRTTAADASKRGDAVEALFLDCVVYPDRAGWDAMLEEYPALCENFFPDLLHIAGATNKTDVKKY